MKQVVGYLKNYLSQFKTVYVFLRNPPKSEKSTDNISGYRTRRVAVSVVIDGGNHRFFKIIGVF